MKIIIEKYLGIFIICILFWILMGNWIFFLLIPLIFIWFLKYQKPKRKIFQESLGNLQDSRKIEELFRENELFSEKDFEKLCNEFVKYYRAEMKRGHSMSPEFILKSYLVFRN